MRIKQLSLCALFAALHCVCAWLSIPAFGVNLTLQSFSLFLSLLLLGGKGGCAAICVYLCLGAVGLPVFSGFQGGIGVLAGPSGGFLWGFLLLGLVYWLLTGAFGEKLRLPALFLGQGLCYVCGAAWFAWGFGGENAVVLTVLPFLLPDWVKLTLAHLLSKRLKRFV